jgi:hypothetical protein
MFTKEISINIVLANTSQNNIMGGFTTFRCWKVEILVFFKTNDHNFHIELLSLWIVVYHTQGGS